MNNTFDKPESNPGFQKAIQLMRLIANRAPTIKVDGHFCTVVAPPTIEHFPGLLALANVKRKLGLDVDRSLELGRVATLISTQLKDVVHSFQHNADGAVGEEFLDQTRFIPGTFPPLHKLPEEFPERSDGVIPEGVVDLLLATSSKKPIHETAREACWDYFRLCENPVIIICQQPSKVAAELVDLAIENEWWTPEQIAATFDAGTGPEDWFRRPIICINPRSIQNRQWMGELKPSAVIVIGYSAWATPARWVWPDLPHTLFLDNRSDDVLRFRTWHDGQQFPTIHSEFAKLKGIPGLPVKFFTEPFLAPEQFSDSDWDSYGADFE